MKRVFKISDIIFEIEYKYRLANELLKEYLYEGETQPTEFISITDSDIEFEKQHAETFEPAVLEMGAILRKYAEICITKHKGLIFHASAIKYNDGAYLFTAHSGTGKSTHTSLLKELLGDKVEFINDDKPTLKFTDNGVIVYGNPWCGKHLRGNNLSAPLKAIIKIERGENNKVESISPNNMLPTLFEQSYKSNKSENAGMLLEYFFTLLNGVKLYKLTCNKDISAAKLSFSEILSKWGYYENKKRFYFKRKYDG